MLSEIYIKNKILLEYVWIDTDGNTRSKNKIISTV